MYLCSASLCTDVNMCVSHHVLLPLSLLFLYPSSVYLCGSFSPNSATPSQPLPRPLTPLPYLGHPVSTNPRHVPNTSSL